MKISDTDVRREADHLLSLGFIYEGLNGNAHHRFSHPLYGRLTVANSPSDHRWIKNHRGQLAERLGCSLGELELRLGIKRPKSERPKRRSPRQRQKRTVATPSRGPRTLPQLPAGALLEAKRREMRELAPRLEAAIRTEHDDAEELVEIDARLRLEILELEAVTGKAA